MQFSKRLDLFGDEVFASLNQKRRELEAAGRPVWDLSVGTPDFPTPDYIKKALVDSCADDANWKYALHDKEELKQAVCDYYKRRFDVDGLEPDQVMSCRGTQEGMQYVCAALADPGDIALIPDPCYPVFRSGTQLAGATPYYYQLTAEHGFLPHVADIPDDVADKAKYMIVSLPANPVGSVGTPEVYEEIIAFAKKHDIVIVHDNAYADVVFEGVSSSFFNYPGAMDVGVEFLSLSKSFDVTGVRLSFLVGRKDIVQATYKLRSQVDFGMFFAEQNVAIACLKGPLDGVERQRLAYKERRDALCDGLEAIGWERPNCHGTLFVWARLPHGRTDSLAFTLELMEKTGVIVTPGASFGPAGEGYVRFALVLPPEKIKEAVAQIGKADL
ncbi:aminotransferase class I/II-fold pyridoxal phosphate-dependent enzyme [Olsenella sp. YH-ols2221]|jgi:LL-diaminopimelate aminotransferase|uniref:pyridoxal phosphate-dependent aminotransferase n=1 Tax=Olsenella kribbiana TaxID=3115221 RepID=UPI002A994E1F|nr:aminotransferase class I/II-fold pyridoxal phosphate-dependent enzyme [Olsenella sp.]MDD5845252.1 aminotransferase class I/II-fold pyridoxal phosphate-dependent enzyme [Olsenella sp.]MDD6705844.1 aminotransferase class I/II-fold pyridoxal phosphate-dependent enzyme [Olsenella sp.]MDY5276020.1 aminotransferase class I/II-fold pyridoxal phosphate-dependent enzyme [Atopobiaceae bacterium]